MLAGLAIAAGLWWALKAFGRATPATLVRTGKRIAGVLALAVGAVLMLRGRLDMALLVAGFGTWLLGWAEAPALATRIGALFGRKMSPPGERAASLYVEVWRDPAGRLGGRVLAGPWAGRGLDTLDGGEFAALRDLCRTDDPEGVRLVEAYLHGRASAGREHAEAGAHAWGRADAQRGAMSKQEAYEVLGLQPGAGAGEIRAAHRALMKKLHPDQGGSTYLASRVNQAKDVLLDTHG